VIKDNDLGSDVFKRTVKRPADTAIGLPWVRSGESNIGVVMEDNDLRSDVSIRVVLTTTILVVMTSRTSRTR
jgi:hypothetical protein